MVNAQSFLSKIIAFPEDDAPRRLYADWLEEHGEPALAETIRLECELAAMPRRVVIPIGQYADIEGDTLRVHIVGRKDGTIYENDTIVFRIAAMNSDVITTVASASYYPLVDGERCCDVVATIKSQAPFGSRRDEIESRLQAIEQAIGRLDKDLSRKDRGLYTRLGFQCRPDEGIERLVMKMSLLHPIADTVFRGKTEGNYFGFELPFDPIWWFELAKRHWHHFERRAIDEENRELMAGARD